MKHFTALLLVIFLSGVLVPAAGASPGGQVVEQALAGPEQAVSLASSTAAGVAFDVRVPWETLVVEPVTAGGKEYVRVSLPGWQAVAEAGAPALPLLTHTVGVPPGASVTVRVSPGKAHTQTLPAPVLPASTQKVEWGLPSPDGDLTMPEPFVVFEEDTEVYSSAALYPQALAAVTNDGILRRQRVIGVAAYPVQYNPATGEITVYESLRVEVAFKGVEGLLAAGAAQVESPVYEHLLQTSLLNYDAARSWRSDLLPAPAANDAQAGELGVAAAPWSPPNPGWRVKVRADGLYRLTYTQLQNAGFPVTTLDPRTFRMHYLGSEVAIYVAGEADGQFNADDYILFYGQAVASKYTLDNVYWLTYGQGDGLRMASRDGTPNAGTTPAFYYAQRRFEQGKYYLPGTPGDEDLERWMWDYVYAPSRPSWSHTFSLAAPYAGTASLTVALMGGIQAAANPDHHAQITVNGTPVGDFKWDGLTWNIPVMEIPQGVLVPMTNTLQVVAPNDTGVGYDLIYIDWADLAFPNTFTAEANALPFTYREAGTWKYEVVGFTSNEVAVFDVTNPASVKRIEGVGVTSSGDGYAASFKDTVTSTSSYWAVASAAYKTVQGIEADTASTLQATSNGADHIIITHPTFAAQAAQLSTFRATQGMRAVVVSVQDV
jgi:hypothetical protein